MNKQTNLEKQNKEKNMLFGAGVGSVPYILLPDGSSPYSFQNAPSPPLGKVKLMEIPAAANGYQDKEQSCISSSESTLGQPCDGINQSGGSKKTDDEQLIRLPELLRMTGMKRSSVYNKSNRASKFYDPKFPKRLQLGKRSVAWWRSEVAAWMKSRPVKGGV